jgi:hypothetical protein
MLRETIWFRLMLQPITCIVLYFIVFYLHSVYPYKDIEQVKISLNLDTHISLNLDTHKDIKHVKIAIHIGTYTNIKEFP